jgi:hypothetical protein
MPLDPEEFNRTLERNHFARVPHGMRQADLEAAANAFLAFLALPDGVIRQLHFSPVHDRASADGFTDKTGVDRKDPKQFFHWSPALMTREPCPSLRAQEPAVDRFFRAASDVYRCVESALFDVYSQCLPEYRQRIFREDRLIDGILRFLCYAPRPEHDFCARAHFDKGFSTLALADSASGLRIGCCNTHPLKPVHHEDGHALFMPAWMLFQASGGAIKPAWHDVVHRPGEQDVNRLCARWSIVFFVNDPGTPFSSWDAVHTPLH